MSSKDHRSLSQIQHELTKIKNERVELDRKEARLKVELIALRDAVIEAVGE